MSICANEKRSGRVGQSRDFGPVGPVDPWQERADIRQLDRRTAPDAQARRRVAIGTDIISNTFSLEPFGDGFCKTSAVGDAGIGEFQADRRIRARGRIGGKVINPVMRGHEFTDRPGIGIGARDQPVKAALGPAQSSAKR